MKDSTSHKNILIFGSGQFGLMTFYAFENESTGEDKIFGFIDVDVLNKNKTLVGLKVYDLKQIDSSFVQKYSIAEVVIAVQNMEIVVLFDISIKLLNLNLILKIIPPAEQCFHGLNLNQIKDLSIDDLILKAPKFDLNPVLLDDYQNQIILITGAAGSIGSELVKQLIPYQCKSIILLDNAESALYNLQQELLQKCISNFVTVIADIRDYRSIDQLFDTYKPKIVFHAAAYKHVPLMEDHPIEAVNVNVVGTKNVANASVKHSVHKFILISTDKAVNPTNVMGATKRIAELYINGLKEKGQTKFITSRFGNVLASNGSVIPLFKRQIENDGPVTLTHREMERFFMTISEACHLILEAGSIGNGSEIFVFDMGQSIKIYDLASMMIKLSGKDIPIKITGLRAGEKVLEELLAPNEQAKPTYHQKIRVAQNRQLPNKNVRAKILELCNKAPKVQNLELVALIKSIVPEYISNNSKFEVLDPKKK